MFKGDQRQLFRQALSAYRWQEIHFLKFTDIRLAAKQWGNAAAAHDLAVLFNDPVGMARLAVQLKKFVQIWVGHGVAFVGGQAIFGRNRADNGGDSRVVAGGYPAECREGLRGAHFVTQSIKIHHSDI